MITVLLVDDQAIVRTGLRTMLGAEADIDVVGEVADGSEVPAAVAGLDPDVVLMDVRMPVVDGIEATRRLVAAGSRSRVCVLTTYSVDDNVYAALTAGAAGFLLKTDSPDRIASTVRAVAAGEFALGTDTTRHLVARYLDTRPPEPPTDDPLAPLTTREREVFAHVAEGLSNAEIASRIFIGEGTVKTHVARILTKLHLRDRVQVVVFAHRNRLIG
jgi:DNA-binding NarL/FixJ family response regulator